MKIFLTGGTGYIGTNFIKYALKKNHKITLITSGNENASKKNNKKTETKAFKTKTTAK